MAGFKTHITVSSILGAGYGSAAYFVYGVPWPACALAGGMCGMAGMLPDIDSDSGRPLHESVAFLAAVMPMMLIGRIKNLELPHETIVLAGAVLYLLVRFGATWLLKHCTVHRGMFHSLPAAAIFGEIAFLLSTGEDVRIRAYKAGAVVLGYVSHLALDELYSIEWNRGRLRLKKSFGTGMKFFGDNIWANVSTYAKLAILTTVIFYEPHLPREPVNPKNPSPVQQSAERLLYDVLHR
jgi:hypothetical protein